jgi:hypothetical protein
VQLEFGGRRHIITWQHFDDLAPATGIDGHGRTFTRESVATLLEHMQQLPAPERKERGVPYKATRHIRCSKCIDCECCSGHLVTYNGLTICRIKVLKADAESLPVSERWETIAEGYAFKRSDEKAFDKKAGRKHSMARALKGPTIYASRFPMVFQTEVWNEYFRIWPNDSETAATWKKRYKALEKRIQGLEQEIGFEVQKRLDAEADAVRLRTTHR